MSLSSRNAVEDAVIARLTARSPKPPEGPGDDAAVLADGTVVTVDLLVEGVHFDGRLSGADVGWKALAVSVSDVCAMGAEPRWAVLALALPEGFSQAWLDDFAAGFAEGLAAYGVALIGGDTTRSPGPVFASVTVGGRPARAPVLRSGARVGDDLWITGWPGLAGLGYVAQEPPPEALEALRRPRPHVGFATGLAEQGLAGAMMDVSDGLASDLPRLCAASGVGAVVDPAAIPAHPALAGRADRLALQVCAGDDYALLFAADPSQRDSIVALAASVGVAVARIGRCTPEPDVQLAGVPWPAPLFAHFSESA